MPNFSKAFSLPADGVRQAVPPGTIPLVDDPEHVSDHEPVRTDTGHHEIDRPQLHLQPEPSLDPADHLDWAMWRKVLVLSVMALYAFINNITSSIISSALPNLITAFATFSNHGPPTGVVPFSTLSHLIAVNVLLTGAGNILIVSLSNTYGRRAINILSLAMLTAFSIWATEAKTFNSLLAARTPQGLGGAASDTLAPDVIGHVFFVHQRGRAMAVYTVMLVGGSLVGGVIGSYITVDPGWRWTMWISAIIGGANLVMAIFLLPETLFDREEAMRRVGGIDEVGTQATSEKSKGVSRLNRLDTVQIYAPYTFARSLGFSRPRAGLVRRFWRSYLTLQLPGTWMLMLMYAGLVGLVVTVSTVGPSVVSAPPYLWGKNAGLINIGALLGCVFGGTYIYLSADWLVKRAARKDTHGYSEPERRLPLMVPGLIMSTFGSLVFGFCAQHPTPKAWVGLCVGYGMIAFGLMVAPSIGFNYIIEAYGALASDCFLMIVTFRSIIAFAWTFFVGTWVAKKGPAEPFGRFAMLMGLFGLILVPVWIFGKRMRIATAPFVTRGAVL
ncbi:MFS general substrate transporter [Myriangium duriaei CBS 260.36]|uniref:MFS general substrate transporter n=1 Tax=Myriangium duriaei CBS 260.36 TaxID=1168546 RepID=A0A9P4MH64_9PEZI|nr:MFS general substrate transporter [Myriangium duriaei CBS 260.36]